MAGIEYQHIGHDPRFGEIALWSVDESGNVLEDRRNFEQPDAAWLGWSHDRVFPEIKLAAAGRVEINRRAGSIHINDPDLGLRPVKLVRLLDKLDELYPNTRWFLFGGGFKGEPAAVALAQCSA